MEDDKSYSNESQLNKENEYSALFNRSDCIYTPCYCEENIWKLFEKVQLSNKSNELDDLYAVFISNSSRMIPMFYQRNSTNSDEPVVWDYHVIAVHKKKDLSCSFVYDFDTVLSYPEYFDVYFKKAIQHEEQFQSKFHRVFRVVPARYFLENFASDRSHMIVNSEYTSPPPNYPPIKCESSENNIQEYINMHKHHKHGQIMSHNEFKSFFTTFDS